MTDLGSAGRTAAGTIDLPAWVRAVVAVGPEQPAVQFEGRWRPWSDLASGIDAVHACTTGAGLPEGTRVGVLMRNRPEVVRAVVGILATGHCLVTINPGQPADDLAREIERLRLPVLIAGPADWTEATRAAAVAAGSAGVVLADGDGSGQVIVEGTGRGDREGFTSPGVAVQMLTSGTTGSPKRVDLLYRSLESELESTAHYTSSGTLGEPRLASGVSILWTPLLHIGGLRSLVSNVVAGRRVAMLERFSVASWVALVVEHRPRLISLVPSAMRMVLDAKVPREVFASVQAVTSGTAPLPAATAEEWEQAYGVPVLVLYGATEFAGGVAGWTIRDWREFGASKRGSVGRVNPGIEARVVDQISGAPLATGGVGLLEVRGPQLAGAGWLRTTDLARIDEDGFIWIDGRADDVIIRGGFKVATGAVADVLRRHPAVLDASVVGMADQRLGTVPVAAVELRPGSHVSEADLAAWARQQLSGYQTPVAWRIVDALPRTPSMKVSQPGVRQLFASGGA